MRNNNKTPSDFSRSPASPEHHRVDLLERQVQDLERRFGLAQKLLHDRFRGEKSPYERLHSCLSRSQGLAGLLCQLYGWQTVKDLDFAPFHLEKTAETLELEIKEALLILDDFWQNAGGCEDWKAREAALNGDAP